MGLTLSDPIDLRSVTRQTFIVRLMGGRPLEGRYSHQTGIVNFCPDVPLRRDATYEVVLPKGGILDGSGNPIEAEFRSTFSTRIVENLASRVEKNPPTAVGAKIGFRLGPVADGRGLRTSWSFGDESPPTPFAADRTSSHAYAEPGHYTVTVRLTNGRRTSAATFVQTVFRPPTKIRPSRSSTIIYDRTGRRVWNVNPDNGTVTAIDAETLKKVREVAVGRNPRTLARAPDGSIWVANQDDATITVIGVKTGTIALPPASRPYGIAFSPDGKAAYVTLEATGKLLRIDASTRVVLDTLDAGPRPRGLAISRDSRVFVSRFISPATHGEVIEAGRRHRLSADPGPDREDSGRGIPNYLGSPTISPDGRRLWIPSKKDNTLRGLARDGLKPTFESTVRTIVSQIDLVAGKEDLSARIDLDDRDLAAAVAFSPLGDLVFVAAQGSGIVDVFDAYDRRKVTSIVDTGLAPQGIVLSPDGRRLFVHNFLSRTVAVYDVSGIVELTTHSARRLAVIPTVSEEKLTKKVLLGKRIFTNAREDPRSTIGCRR